MDLGIVLSTVGGAAIALVGTVLADILRRRNERDRDGRVERRQSYVDFVLGLNNSHEHLRNVARDPGPDGVLIAANRAVAEVFRGREMLLVSAHPSVVSAGERAFQDLMRVRDVIRAGATLASKEYHDAYHAYAASVWQLRQDIREDLGVRRLDPDDVDRSAWDVRSDCATCRARDEQAQQATAVGA